MKPNATVHGCNPSTPKERWEVEKGRIAQKLKRQGRPKCVEQQSKGDPTLARCRRETSPERDLEPTPL